MPLDPIKSRRGSLRNEAPICRAKHGARAKLQGHNARDAKRSRDLLGIGVNIVI